jgi:protein tyrosine phosphatase (PTP) superfamily phosphohydrolase (DUF442 family)
MHRARLDRVLVSVALLAAIAFVASCASERGLVDTRPKVLTAAGSIEVPRPDAKAPVNYPGLHNVVTYHAGVYSGSVPEREEGFESLQRMGIKTIISVDGATPDLDMARARGFRYVHLPIGYDGIDTTRSLEIARAVDELSGPVYIHCHHGKHRSAAAAGVACVSLGLLTQDQATARMRVSGTAANYKGLYACVANGKTLTREQLQSASSAFPEAQVAHGLKKIMIEIDVVNDLLKDIEKAGWKVPKDHPDLVPAAEADRLEGLLRQLQSDPESKEHEGNFLELAKAAQEGALALEEGILTKESTPEVLSSQFKRVTQACAQCHTKYRD